MVQFRGINISVVSQFDAKRLPEHSTARAFDASGTVVACYIPIYEGAQIWLEYSIDGPHPPKAAYFFKMLIDGQLVSSWDCTAKHQYQGKAVYLLQTIRSSVHGQLAVVQKSMAFGSANGSQSPGTKNDRIEIRIHRIEHRRRIRELSLNIPPPKQSRGQEALRLKDHGLIEPYRPARRYQYQLLDPQEEPYATFRFYYRTQEYLERHQIIDADRPLSSTSLATSAGNYFNANPSPEKKERPVDPAEQEQPSTPTKQIVHGLGTTIENPPVAIKLNPSSRSPTKVYSPLRPYSPRRDRTPSIKDSIEDLPSTVPRSPQSPKRFAFQCKADNTEDVPPSPTQRSSALLPDALRIRNACSPITDIQSSVLTLSPPTPSPEEIALTSPTRRLLPLRHSSLTPPSTASPRPKRLPYRRHKPSHLNLDLKLPSPLTSPFDDITSASSYKPSNNPPPQITTTPHPPHRPLSPFTQSGLLRRLSHSSSLYHRRPSRPATPTLTPFIPTVQEVDAAVGGQVGKTDDHVERKIGGKDVGESGHECGSEATSTSTTTMGTVRRMRSAGLLTGFLRRTSERRVGT